MKRIFLLLIVFSLFSCKDFFRFDLGTGELPGTKLTLPERSVQGFSLIGSDVFVVTQNTAVGKGKQVTNTATITSANFLKDDGSLSSFTQNMVSKSSITVPEAGTDTPRVDPQRYLDFLPFNDGKTDGPVYSKVYNNTTSTPERQSLSSEEMDAADFRDVYMDRKDLTSSYGWRYKPIKFRNMKVTSSNCRIYIEEELYQIYLSGGNEKFHVPTGRDADFIAKRSQQAAEKFDRILTAVTSAMGKPIYKMLDAGLNPVDMVDKKINIFVGCLREALDAPPDSIMGYFSSKDYSVFNPDRYGTGSPNGSNESLCFYITDGNFMAENDDSLKIMYGTLAHELTHMLNYGQKTIIHRASYSTWFTECLATTMEDGVSEITHGATNGLGSTIAFIVPYYLYDADNEHVSVGIGEWDGGFAYREYMMMGGYLLRNFGGINLLKEVATSRYGDVEAWDHAIAKYSTDPDVTDFRSAMTKYPLAMITLAGYPQTTPGKYDFCKSASNSLLKFDTYEVVFDRDSTSELRNTGYFPEPYPRYSLPSKTFNALDFHVDHLGKFTTDSVIFYDNLAAGSYIGIQNIVCLYITLCGYITLLNKIGMYVSSCADFPSHVSLDTALQNDIATGR
ncbi:MAG: hypothetical protein IIW10_02575 [Spirochaetaceae bacterium]|nr:hypothetical protein [Spirochaetaceae bacterium]